MSASNQGQGNSEQDQVASTVLQGPSGKVLPIPHIVGGVGVAPKNAPAGKQVCLDKRVGERRLPHSEPP